MLEKSLSRLLIACIAIGPLCALSLANEPINIGSRLELFVDDYLIDKMNDARLVLHHPISREVAIDHNEPWEGNICCGHTVFQDGDIYRMYYRGRHHDSEKNRETHWFSCYAESTDGIHWTKPELGLVEFRGSKKNNIILDGIERFNLAPFKDLNPNCKPDERYKAMTNGHGGMDAYKSPDGIHWSPMVEGHVITKGLFDSLNLAFWDPLRGCLRGIPSRLPRRHSRHHDRHVQRFHPLDRSGLDRVSRFSAAAPLHQRHQALLSGTAHPHGLSQAVCPRPARQRRINTRAYPTRYS